MTKMIKNTLGIEGIWLRIFPESYFLAWKGCASLDHLFETEECLLKEYSELLDKHIPVFAFHKEIAYLTSEGGIELKLKSSIDAFVGYSNFLKKPYQDKVIFTMITNPLFTLAADIYSKYKPEEKNSITIDLKKINLKIDPIIEDIVEFYEQTGSDVRRMFSDKHKKKIVSAINKAISKEWTTFQEKS